MIVPARKKPAADSLEQYRRFVEQAKELGADYDERKFKAVVKKVATFKGAAKKPASRSK